MGTPARAPGCRRGWRACRRSCTPRTGMLFAGPVTRSRIIILQDSHRCEQNSSPHHVGRPSHLQGAIRLCILISRQACSSPQRQPTRRVRHEHGSKAQAFPSVKTAQRHVYLATPRLTVITPQKIFNKPKTTPIGTAAFCRSVGFLACHQPQNAKGPTTAKTI